MGRVGEPQLGRVQGQPGGPAAVVVGRSVRPLDVDLVAANRVPGLGQVDPNLVRPARLQPARQQCVAREPLLDRDVGDGLLAGPGQRRAPAAAVAPVRDQSGADRPRRQVAGDDREVAPHDRVVPELRPEFPFRQGRPGEADEPARLLVEPVDDPQERQPLGRPVQPVGDGPLGQVLQGRVEPPPLLGPLPLLRVADGVHPRRLLDHDDMVVEVPDHEPFGVGGPGEGLRLAEQLDHLALLEPPGVVGADRVADLDPAGGDELLDLAPGRPTEPGPEDLGQGVPGLGGRHGERREGGHRGYFLANKTSRLTVRLAANVKTTVATPSQNCHRRRSDSSRHFWRSATSASITANRSRSPTRLAVSSDSRV